MQVPQGCMRAASLGDQLLFPPQQNQQNKIIKIILNIKARLVHVVQASRSCA
jgi:hypothetical protein